MIGNDILIQIIVSIHKTHTTYVLREYSTNYNCLSYVGFKLFFIITLLKFSYRVKAQNKTLVAFMDTDNYYLLLINLNKVSRCGVYHWF